MTKTDVYELEHMCVNELVLSDCGDLSAEWKEHLLGYIDGVNTMAAMMVDSLAKEEG